MKTAIIQRCWDERWDDLEAAGWEKSSVTQAVWHPKWGCKSIIQACELQDAQDVKRGRIAAMCVAVVFGLIWLIITL